MGLTIYNLDHQLLQAFYVFFLCYNKPCMFAHCICGWWVSGVLPIMLWA